MAMELYCCELADDTVNRARPDPTLYNDPRTIESMLTLETKYLPCCTYFHSLQTDILPYMRREVTSWMLEVCEEQGCEEVVFPLSVNILDRFLSTSNIKKGQLQCAGAVALLLASKFRQCRAFTAEQLSHYTDQSVSAQEITSWELLILGRLRWDLGAILATDYVDIVLKRLHDGVSTPRIRQHAHTFICLCAIEHRFLVYSPSVIAAASIAAAVHGLQGPNQFFDDVMEQLQHLLYVDKSLLQTCVNEIEHLVSSSVDSLQQQSQQNSLAKQGSSPFPSVKTSSPTTSTSDDLSQPETPTDVQDIHF